MKKIKNVDMIATGVGIVTSACIGYTLGKVVISLLPLNNISVEKLEIMLPMKLSRYWN